MPLASLQVRGVFSISVNIDKIEEYDHRSNFSSSVFVGAFSEIIEVAFFLNTHGLIPDHLGINRNP